MRGSMRAYRFLERVPKVRGWIAAAYYGKGVARFAKKDYVSAIRNLELARILDVDFDKEWSGLSLLGRCYLGIYRFEDAERILTLSYRNLPADLSDIDCEVTRKDYVATLVGLSRALNALGKRDRAADLAREARMHAFRER